MPAFNVKDDFAILGFIFVGTNVYLIRVGFDSDQKAPNFDGGILKDRFLNLFPIQVQNINGTMMIVG